MPRAIRRWALGTRISGGSSSGRPFRATRRPRTPSSPTPEAAAMVRPVVEARGRDASTWSSHRAGVRPAAAAVAPVTEGLFPGMPAEGRGRRPGLDDHDRRRQPRGLRALAQDHPRPRPVLRAHRRRLGRPSVSANGWPGPLLSAAASRSDVHPGLGLLGRSSGTHSPWAATKSPIRATTSASSWLGSCIPICEKGAQCSSGCEGADTVGASLGVRPSTPFAHAWEARFSDDFGTPPSWSRHAVRERP